MPTDLTRRSFLQSTAALAATAAIPAAASATPATTQAKKLNIGIVGVGGRGFDHVRQVKEIPEANVVALCDVDAGMLVNACRHITAAQPFVDFRDMLKMKDLEAVIVSTPDHTHAVIAAAALRAGKHVYCEKPLAHTIKETRTLTELAKQTKLVTQLGIQIHALENYRKVVEIIRSGAIGPVRQVEIWNNRTNRPADANDAKPPASLNYDLWLGPAADRPFRRDYHPYNWRRWWSFGEGMLGDIGCHLMDVAFWALDLTAPTRVSADGAPRSDEITAEWIVAHYDFPARGDRPAVRLSWYDAPKTPPKLSEWKLDAKLAGEGVMFIGDAGMLYSNYTEHRLLPAEKFKDFKAPPPSIPRSPGHQREWIQACLKNDPSAASAPFAYGGRLTETALLGVIAFHACKELEWDATNLKIVNAPDAEKFLTYQYRSGWTL